MISFDKLKPGMNLRVVWDDGEEVRGTFVIVERGYIVLDCSGSSQACLPAHLKYIEVLNETTS